MAVSIAHSSKLCMGVISAKQHYAYMHWYEWYKSEMARQYAIGDYHRAGFDYVTNTCMYIIFSGFLHTQIKLTTLTSPHQSYGM